MNVLAFAVLGCSPSPEPQAVEAPIPPEQACQQGDGAVCAALAAAAETPETRDRWLTAACQGGEAISCLPAADTARRSGDLTLAARLYAARCAALPDDVACSLAQIVEDQVAQTEACDADEVAACRALCTKARTEGACAAAAESWAVACDGGDGPSCRAQAEALDVSGGDAQTVNELLWNACDETSPVDPWGCLRLADRVERNRGTLPTRARGDVSWLRNQACDLQLDYACAPHRGW